MPIGLRFGQMTLRTSELLPTMAVTMTMADDDNNDDDDDDGWLQ